MRSSAQSRVCLPLLLVVSVALPFIYVFSDRFRSGGHPTRYDEKTNVKVVTSMCGEDLRGGNGSSSIDAPLIYFVTPTFPRREQSADLTRLGQTLLHVKNIVWIVAEDSQQCSQGVKDILLRLQIPYVHMISPMPEVYKKEFYKPRGVSSRNAALEWIQKIQKPGIVYFGDDDNTYDLRLFDEIRSTKKVSMFPVGLIGSQGVSSPIVKDGVVVGFTDSWFEERMFPVDMAGFAFHSDLLGKSNLTRMPYKAGHEEDLFLRMLNVSTKDIEPKANDCTDILVWHTRTTKNPVPELEIPSTGRAGETNLAQLVQYAGDVGMVKVVDKGNKIKTCFKQQCKT